MSKLSTLISVVEDDEIVRLSTRRLLRSFGYAAEAFSSAADFLASPNLGETACLVSDINMPGMTGIELFQRLKETGRTIPTVLITAYPDDAVRDRVLKEGACCYLLKPFDDKELLRCVRLAIGEIPPPVKP